MERRTYQDRRAYLAKATNNRRRRLKKPLVERKGGKCQFCGYSKYIGALDFHHLDPSKKNFKLSMEELYRSWDITTKEIDKCILVCANCHRELHGGVLKLMSSVTRNEPVPMV
jgi:5-methylcytosine-specific restriction endonuclease McrA